MEGGGTSEDTRYDYTTGPEILWEDDVREFIIEPDDRVRFTEEITLDVFTRVWEKANTLPAIGA